MPPRNQSKKMKINEEGASLPCESGGSPEPVAELTRDTSSATAADVVTPKFANDWQHCSLGGFVGNVGVEDKNPKFIMMNLSPIPCCAEKCRDGDKCSAVRIAVIHAHSAGFSKAPYTLPFGGGKGKLGENPKPLSELIDVPSIEDSSVMMKGMRMWPFKKEAVPGSRGVCLDDKSFVCTSYVE